jgi:hypothetical protein
MKILSCLLLILASVSFVLADIPAPPVAQSIRIELLQNSPDYQFYLCSYRLEVKPNPNPPHPSRPNMIVKVPDSFELKKIELSPDKPYHEKLGNSRIQYRGSLYDKELYLVAIKKSQMAELEPKIKEAIDNDKEGDYEIRFVTLGTAILANGDGRKGAKVIVNKISLDEKDMIRNVYEGMTSSSSDKTLNNIGLGFLLTGLVFGGGWWTRRRFFEKS